MSWTCVRLRRSVGASERKGRCPAFYLLYKYSLALKLNVRDASKKKKEKRKDIVREARPIIIVSHARSSM